MQYLILYLLTIPVFMIGDLLWLGVFAKAFYQNNLGHLLGPVNWGAAGAFYLIYLAGLLFFAVVPALDAASITKAIVLGALFGFVTYATYDFTNYATMKDWPFIVVIVDVIWGAVLGGTVAAVSYSIGKLIF